MPNLHNLDWLDPRTWAPWSAERDACYVVWPRYPHVRARVDPEIYHLLARYGWNAFVTRSQKTYFRRSRHVGGKVLTVLLHREVMDLHGVAPAHVDERVVDHRDGCELDCRLASLRWATYRTNTLNRRSA